MIRLLPFEKSLDNYNKQLEKLRSKKDESQDMDIPKPKSDLIKKYNHKLNNIYKNLTPWDKVQISRHELRPHFLDYLEHIVDDFIPLNGDRTFGEDSALIGGIGTIDNHPLMIIGLEKGKDVQSRVKHNFGMVHPEGYRKAVRLIKLASKFRVPVISMIDTPGAYPGMDAEKRGQAEAIARSIQAYLNIDSPTLSIILGEGASGGAIALAASDQLVMLKYAIYSVISPEGAASILFKDAKKAEKAATQMHLTSDDMLNFNIIDHIIDEPIGGSHRYPLEAYKNVKDYILNFLEDYKNCDIKQLHTKRFQKYMNLNPIEKPVLI